MKAFHNDETIKQKYIDRLKKHYDADEFIKGKYWENGKGCAVGCTIHSSDHSRYETEIGVPEWLARVEDTIFEGLENSKAKEWPIKFLQSIKVGADLEKIKIPFLIFVVESTLDKFDHEKFPDVKKSIQNVLCILRENRRLDSAASASAYASAYAAAAASAAADFAAAAAASAAADFAAAAAAASAAADFAAAASAYAASGAAGADEKEKAYEDFSRKLIELLEEI